MRILVLCKRRYTGKDLLADRYGRLWEIPAALSVAGHEVLGVAASYRPDRPVAPPSWRSVAAPPHPHFLARMWAHSLGAFRPDIIWASSDAAHLVAASRLGRAWDVPVVLDHYDDYEAFGLTRWLGLTSALRMATSAAAAVTVVGHQLEASLVQRGTSRNRVHVVPNGVPTGFAPALSREDARRRLGLPLDVRLFGTAGALDASRGISDLGDAARLLYGEARLVIAGPGARDAMGRLPDDVIDLGLLPHADVAMLFRALDVGVVCNRDTTFGRHCYPMKLVEMGACGLPVVVAAVGEAATLLAGTPEALYPAGDGQVLADRLRSLLHGPKGAPPPFVMTWPVLAGGVEKILKHAIESARC